MRAAMVVLGVLVLAAGVVLYAVQAGRGAGGSRATGSGGVTSDAAPDPGATAATPTAEELALAELREELDKAEPVSYRSDEQRLEDARAWVAANRDPDRPYNEIEAKILALMDVLLDGKKRSAEWTMNMSQIEVEMIRAIDADGDGQVSDEEVQLFIDENIASMFNPMEHPYLREQFDTNGDGEVSPDEMAEFASMLGDGALAGAFERGKLEAWDSDNDGFVSAEERVAGEQAAGLRMREMYGEMLSAMGGEAVNALLGDPALSEEERAAAREQFYQQIGEDAARMLDSQREMMLSQAAAEGFLNDLRLDNLPQPDMSEILKSMPTPPEPLAFDVDGDGSLSEDETAAQTQAMQEYQTEVQRWGSELTAYRLKDQFDNAIVQSDTDGDERMSPDEWESRIGNLLDERERRLFLNTYDLDGSGRVEAGELSTYLDWYRAGSLRADVNYDGATNALDLEQVARTFQQQGG